MIKLCRQICKLMLLVLVFTLAIPMNVKAVSSNNYLVDVKFELGVLNKKFDSKTVNYTLTVPKGTTSVEASGTLSDSTANLNIGGENLSTGKIVFTVRAENNAVRYYTFKIVYSDEVPVTTSPVTTTSKPPATSTSSPSTSSGGSTSDSTSETTSSISEITTSESLTTDNSTQALLAHLSIKNLKFTNTFNSKNYEYTILVDEYSPDYQVEYITTSPNASVAVNARNEKYIIEVLNGENKTVYVINFKLKVNNSSFDENSQNYSIIKNSLFALLLLLMSIMLFVLSKKLSK